MKKVNLFFIILFNSLVFAQVNQVGIHTVDPKATWHVDSQADNDADNNTLAEQEEDDVVFTDLGRLGIGTQTPESTLDIRGVRDNNTAPEGLVFPVITRERANAMGATGNIPEGTLLYINQLDGAEAGTTSEVDVVGFYFFDTALNIWKNIQSNDLVNGETILTTHYFTNNGDGNGAEILTCGGFEFRVDENNHTQYRLSSDPGGSVSISYGYEQIYDNGYQFFKDSNNLWNSSNYNNWQDLTTSGNTIVDRELNRVYMSYPGTQLINNLTFFRDTYGGITHWSILCEIQ